MLCLVQRLFGDAAVSYEPHNAAELGWDKGALVVNIFRCLLSLPPVGDLHPVLRAIAEDTEFTLPAFERAAATFVERCVCFAIVL